MRLVEYPDPDYLLIQENRPDIYPISYSSQAGLNIRDVILPEHVNDGLPAQFVVENADCRLFHTKDMILDVANTWKAAAKAAFQGAKCVVGGLPKRDDAGSKRQEGPAVQAPRIPKTKRVQVEEETVTKDAAWRLRHGRKAFE